MAKKRREFIDNLNLVPFIDLFSTLIIFLIATAVFDQLASVPVSLGSTEQEQIQRPASPADTKRVTADIKVTISQNRVELFDAGRVVRVSREELLAQKFEQVAQFAQQVRGKYVEKKDVVFSVADNAVYSDLISSMDQFLANNFDQLIVMGAE
jgi:biopolymer transport protein ExbD